MKSKIILIAILLVVVSGYLLIKKEESDRERLISQLATASATPTQPADYTEPMVGMDYAAFKKLCGDAGPDDDIREISSARSTVFVLERKYKTDRSATRCYGTFHIDTAKGLTLITR